MPQLHPFRPRLLVSLRGYNRIALGKDVAAGLTVGIVALPLAMAFAIASGLSPQAGLWTAIVAGFLISALGGSSIQIGGPAGAFIVIVYGIVERYGLANLFIATALAGLLLFAMGLFKLGTLVRYVPVSIIIGFTNGIAVLIGLSQLKDALGLQVAKMPADFFSLVTTLGSALPSFNAYALALSMLCLVGLAVWPRLWNSDSGIAKVLDQPGMRRAMETAGRVPGPIVALLTLTLLAYLLQWPVETIGSKFGGIPQNLPAWQWPDFSWETAKLLVTPTLTIALLGAIESLLCARVGDQVLRARPHGEAQDIPVHDPNQELMAQGIANMIVPFIGGMPATGTIARTVTNARAGASSPVAGMVHALTLLAVVLVAAPLAMHIPLAVLAGILLFVAWNMGEWREFGRLKSLSNHYRLIMLGTFFITVVFDLTLALEVGMVLACVLFVRRMGTIFSVVPGSADAQDTSRASYALRGVLFFGAVVKMDGIVQQVQNDKALRTISLDCQELMALDTSGVDALEQLHQLLHARGGRLQLSGLAEQPHSLLRRSGFLDKLARD